MKKWLNVPQVYVGSRKYVLLQFFIGRKNTDTAITIYHRTHVVLKQLLVPTSNTISKSPFSSSSSGFFAARWSFDCMSKHAASYVLTTYIRWVNNKQCPAKLRFFFTFSVLHAVNFLWGMQSACLLPFGLLWNFLVFLCIYYHCVSFFEPRNANRHKSAIVPESL